MKTLIKSAALAALMAISTSSAAWWGGPGWNNGWWDDGLWGDGWGGFSFGFHMGGSGWGSGRGWHRYNSYYYPYHGYGVPYYGAYYPSVTAAPAAPTMEAAK